MRTRLRAGVGAVGLLAILLLPLFWTLPNKVGWAAFAGWATFVATLAAVVAAIVAGNYARKMWALESKRDQRTAELRTREQDARRREHASQITWWTQVSPPDSGRDPAVQEFCDAYGKSLSSAPEPLYEFGMFGREKAYLCILNSSADCIYEVTVKISDIVMTTDDSGRYLLRQVGIVPPGRVWVEIPGPFCDTPTMQERVFAREANNQLLEWIEYRDRSDVLWRRSGLGGLAEQPARPPDTSTWGSV